MVVMSAHPEWQSMWMGVSNHVGNPEEPQKPEVKLSMEFVEMLETDTPSNSGDYSEKVLVATLPVVGRVHVLQDRQGFITVGIIIFYWLYGTWSTICILLWPHYNDGNVSVLPILFYSAVSALCITSFFRAVTSNPGRIPFSKVEGSVASDLPPDLFCQTCQRRRPHRSHHCRRCGQCILRMDHHCPWINNCVGKGNHYLFIQLLAYAFLMGITTLSICVLHLYYWPPCISCQEAFVELGVRGLGYVVQVMTILMSMCMMIAAGGLLFMHYVSALMDMTTIDWMKLRVELNNKKTPSYKDIPSVKMSTIKAMDEICGPGPRFLWPFPCRRRQGALRIAYPDVV